jgi:hypothetical protein
VPGKATPRRPARAAPGASPRAGLPVDGLPEAVNGRLVALVDDLRFWVERERERPTPAQARDDLDKIELQALELQLALEDLDHTPRAHVVANLPPGGLRDIGRALAQLRHAAGAGSAAIPPHQGNTEVGVPRYAAVRILAIFNEHNLPVTVSGSAPTPAMRAFSAVLQGAQYQPLLGDSALCKYLRWAVKEQSSRPKTAE